MALSDKTFFIGGSQIILGTLSGSLFPTKVTAPSGCVGVQIKLLGAAGSTVQILPNVGPAGASIGGATAFTTVGGYPLVTGEMYPFDGPATFYLAAMGATATVATMFLYSSGGASLL